MPLINPTKQSSQEFLIRGEFIESNVIVPDSEQDFFSVPEMILEPPVRQIPSLSSSLSDSSGSPNLQLDLKGSCLDSINYHDKCSPSKSRDEPLVCFSLLEVLCGALNYGNV